MLLFFSSFFTPSVKRFVRNRRALIRLCDFIFPAVKPVEIRIVHVVRKVFGPVFSPDRVPHLEEHDREAVRGVAFQHHACVLPVPVRLRMLHAKILIGKIISAGKSDFPVDDGDLAVIAVVHENIEESADRVEVLALDAVAFHLLHETEGKEFCRADIVIHQAYVHALFRLCIQNFLDFGKAFLILDGEIFHENEFLRTPQRPDLRSAAFLRLRKIHCLRILIHRIIGIVEEIACLRKNPVFRASQIMVCIPVLRKKRGEFRFVGVKMASFRNKREGSGGQKIENDSEYRKNKNHNDPRNLIGCICVTAADPQCHHDRSCFHGSVKIGVIAQKTGDSRCKNPDLNCHKNGNEEDPSCTFPGIIPLFCSDLFLFQNQLSFFLVLT